MATHSSIFAWRIPWTEKPGGLQSQGHTESDMTGRLSMRAHLGLEITLALFSQHLLPLLHFSVYLCTDIFLVCSISRGKQQNGKDQRSLQENQRCGFSPWAGKILWKRAQQPTPVFLPGESHGQRSLEGYSLRVAKSRTQLKCLSMHACNRPPDIFIEKLCFHYTYKHAYKGRYNKVDRKTILNHSDLYFEYSDTDEQ